MSSVNDLRKEFNRIRQEYFPNWRNGAKWTIEPYSGTAFCDRDNRCIRIGDNANRNLTVVIIHEIVHAVTEDGHGKRWQDQLHEVILQARTNGQESLAAELEVHLNDEVTPDNAYDLTAEDVYVEVHDVAFANPSWSYMKAVDEVAKSYGQTRKEFEILYDVRKLQAVFDRARDNL